MSGAPTTQNRVFSYQNRGQMGSRYVYIYLLTTKQSKFAFRSPIMNIPFRDALLLAAPRGRRIYRPFSCRGGSNQPLQGQPSGPRPSQVRRHGAERHPPPVRSVPMSRWSTRIESGASFCAPLAKTRKGASNLLSLCCELYESRMDQMHFTLPSESGRFW